MYLRACMVPSHQVTVIDWKKIDEGKYIRINTEMTYETVMRTPPVGFPSAFLSFENPRNMLDWKVA